MLPAIQGAEQNINKGQQESSWLFDFPRDHRGEERTAEEELAWLDDETVDSPSNSPHAGDLEKSLPLPFTKRKKGRRRDLSVKQERTEELKQNLRDARATRERYHAAQEIAKESGLMAQLIEAKRLEEMLQTLDKPLERIQKTVPPARKSRRRVAPTEPARAEAMGAPHLPRRRCVSGLMHENFPGETPFNIGRKVVEDLLHRPEYKDQVDKDKEVVAYQVQQALRNAHTSAAAVPELEAQYIKDTLTRHSNVPEDPCDTNELQMGNLGVCSETGVLDWGDDEDLQGWGDDTTHGWTVGRSTASLTPPHIPPDACAVLGHDEEL